MVKKEDELEESRESSEVESEALSEVEPEELSEAEPKELSEVEPKELSEVEPKELSEVEKLREEVAQLKKSLADQEKDHRAELRAIEEKLEANRKKSNVDTFARIMKLLE